MSVYCMSDIHGKKSRYDAMLRKINFSDADTLYIIGDVLDRGPDSIELLYDILSRGNVVLLKGNHEQMCIDVFSPYGSGSLGVWFNNGGASTYIDVMEMPKEERMTLVNNLEGLPSCLDISVGEQKYHLVHGVPADNDDDRLWGRFTAETPPPFEDRIVICGHTPTAYINGNHSEPMTIWHQEGIIDIDCGCATSKDTGRLACLRLDDMAEFYID